MRGVNRFPNKTETVNVIIVWKPEVREISVVAGIGKRRKTIGCINAKTRPQSAA